MIRYRFLLRLLVARDLQARYAGSLLGFFWAFANSLWQLVLYSFVFSGIMRIRLVGEGSDNFAAFLFSGLLCWMAFNEGVQKGTLVVVENAELVKKLRFPSEILVLATTVSALSHAAIAFVVFLGIRLGFGGVDWSSGPVFLVALAGQFAFTAGISFFLAAGYVFLRDLQHAVTLLFSALFYLAPIVYPVALVPDRFRWAIEANPLTTVLGAYRAFLIRSEAPPIGDVLMLLAVALATLGLGLTTYRRLSRRFSDEL